MSNRIITIEREYASGGREVGELVAKQLGIPFYNREILEMASERCGVSVDYLASAEEAAPKSVLQPVRQLLDRRLHILFQL